MKKYIVANENITASKVFEIRNNDSGEFEDYKFIEYDDGTALIDKMGGDTNDAYARFDDEGWTISKGYEYLMPDDSGFYDISDFELVAEYCSVADFNGSLYRN